MIDCYLIDLGVFLLVTGGIFAGFFLLAIEIAFKRRKEKREKEIEISRNAFIHWRKSIEVKNYDMLLLFSKVTHSFNKINCEGFRKV